MKSFLLAVGGMLLLSASAPDDAQTLQHIFYDIRVETSESAPSRQRLQLAWTGCGSWEPSITVSRSANVITVSHVISSFGFECIPPGLWADFPLGNFPPGDYTVVYQAVDAFPGIGTYVPLNTQFTVAAPQARAVPASGVWTLSLLVVAAWVVARRHHSKQQ